MCRAAPMRKGVAQVSMWKAVFRLGAAEACLEEREARLLLVDRLWTAIEGKASQVHAPADG